MRACIQRQGRQIRPCEGKISIASPARTLNQTPDLRQDARLVQPPGFQIAFVGRDLNRQPLSILGPFLSERSCHAAASAAP